MGQITFDMVRTVDRNGDALTCRIKKRKAVVRKESPETQNYVSCQDVEVDDNRNLEGIGFVSSAVGELLRVQDTCEKKCSEEGLRLGGHRNSRERHTAHDHFLRELL